LISLVQLAGLRHLLRHPLQSALCVLGIALGVALVLAIDIAIASSEQAFLLSAQAVRGDASHRIVGPPEGLPEEVYRHLRVDHGQRRIAPVLEGQAALRRDGGGVAFRLLGIDPYAELDFRPDFVAASRGGNLLTAGPAAILEAETARGLGLEVGDRLEVEVSGRRFDLILSSVIELADAGRRKLAAQVMVVDIAVAQELLGRVGRLTRIDLRPPEENRSAWLAQLAALLPPWARLEETPRESARLDDMLAAFRLNLSFLSLLALVVATFLIYGTISFGVVERREMLGRLRALGVTGSRMGRLLLVESLALGLPGTLVGLGLGVLLSRGLVDVISATISDHYFVVSVRETATPASSVLKAGLGGIAATLVSAWWPARAAARTPPRILTMRSELEGRLRGGAVLRRVVALAAFVAAAAFAWFPGRSIQPAYAVIVALITGFAALAPDALMLAAHLLARPARALFGFPGLLAVRGLVSGLSRSSVATAALAMALAMTLGVGLMVGSFRGAVADWLGTTLGHDIYVTLPSMMAARQGEGLFSPDEVARMAAIPGVTRVVTNRHLDLVEDGAELRVVILGGALPDRPNFNFLRSGPGDAVWADFRSGRGLLLSEPLAFRRDLSVGDVMTFTGKSGEASLPIVGIFQDYASERGYAFLHESRAQGLWDYSGQSAIALDVAADRPIAAVMADLGAIPGIDRPWSVRSQRGLREASLEIFDRTFRITAVLKLLAGIVAGIGIFSALMALQLERAHEHAVLLARGLSPRGLFGLILGESGLIGLIAALIAIPLGLLFAEVLVNLVNRRSFGWSLPLRIEALPIIEILILGLLAALLAGIPPALYRARSRPAEILGRGGRR
jgi:putative ABC transport system permease protein